MVLPELFPVEPVELPPPAGCFCWEKSCRPPLPPLVPEPDEPLEPPVEPVVDPPELGFPEPDPPELELDPPEVELDPPEGSLTGSGGGADPPEVRGETHWPSYSRRPSRPGSRRQYCW